jgi:multidrug resistance protein MdtO
MALSSYILAGSERISYIGLQIVVTYGLAFMMNFSPSTNLTEVRDRMIGVVLGILVYTFVSTLLWPEREGQSARDALADLLKEIGKFLEPIRQQMATAASTAVAQQHLAVMTKLGKSEQILARVALEPGGQEELTLTLQTILAQARSLAVAANTLQLELEVHGGGLPVEIREAVEALQKQIIGALDAYADGLKSDACQSPAPIPLDTLKRSLAISSTAVSETCQSAILNAAENLVRQFAALPSWGVAESTSTDFDMVPNYE